MTIEALYYCMPLLGLLFMGLLYSLFVRVFPGRRDAKGAFIVAIGWTLAITPFYVLTSYSIVEDSMDRLFSNLLQIASTLAVGYCFFHFVNILVSSLRVRLLEEIGVSGATRTAILNHYNDGVILNARLARLIEGGHLLKRGDRFYAGKRGFLFIYSIFHCLKLLYLGHSFDICSARKDDHIK